MKYIYIGLLHIATNYLLTDGMKMESNSSAIKNLTQKERKGLKAKNERANE